jgi:hypothetical protein
MSTVRDARNRLLFEGQEADALEFVEKNFPHVHVEPGFPYAGPPSADVVVTGDDGGQVAFVGGEWQDVNYVVENGQFRQREEGKVA